VSIPIYLYPCKKKKTGETKTTSQVKPKPESQNPQAKRQKPSETKMKPSEIKRGK